MSGWDIASLGANAVMLIALITLVKLLWGMRPGMVKAAKATAAGVVTAVKTVKDEPDVPKGMFEGVDEPPRCPTNEQKAMLIPPGHEFNIVNLADPKDTCKGVHECRNCNLVVVLSDRCDR